MLEKNEFSYFHPIRVRYADLDLQRHVNNAVYLTYLESARLGYYEQVGIWKRETELLTGMVVARIEIDYLSPIHLEHEIQVGLRLERLGEKSFTLAFLIESISGEKVFSRGKTVMVAYNDENELSIPLPPDWREKLTRFENQNQNGNG